MAASARIVLAFIIIYVMDFKLRDVQFGFFNTHKHCNVKTHRLKLDVFATIGSRRGISKVALTSTGYCKLQIAATKYGKRAIRSLAIPSRDPPRVEISIFCDVEINPGPDRSDFSDKQVLAEHSESLFTSLSPFHSYF